MDELFETERRRRLVLKTGRERVVAQRHPWIFAGAIARESGPQDAAVADLVDAAGTVIASGLHSLHSQIRLRAWTFGDEAFTAQLFRDRIEASVARRASRFGAANDAARLIHAEGDGCSGLVVDRYGSLLVVEIANAGLERLRPLVVDALRAVSPFSAAYFKNDLPARRLEQLPAEGECIGDGEQSATIHEAGLRFVVEPATGQKTGFFLDQRENRLRARSLAGGRRVLNLFCYSGAFGVHTAAGGAASVVNVDTSEPAVALARRNHEINKLAADASFVVADAFSFVRERNAAHDAFDLVICDPPAFAKSRSEVERAARGYKDINLQAFRLIAPGGLLMTFSCSGHMSLDLFQKVIFSAALDAGRSASIVGRLTAGTDHPVSIYCPEGEYLKGLLVRVD